MFKVFLKLFGSGSIFCGVTIDGFLSVKKARSTSGPTAEWQPSHNTYVAGQLQQERMQALNEPAVCVLPVQPEYQAEVWMSEPAIQVTNEAPSAVYGTEPCWRIEMVLD